MNELRNRLERKSLLRRISLLEDEVQECRQLNLRVAELCDVMMELMLPDADRDEQALAAAVDRYRREVAPPRKA